uniref:Uncharacterized protein n=1 Tax=Fagus sylvatica TaxID=28930 RepID=A0A2N9H678_FAGSY
MDTAMMMDDLISRTKNFSCANNRLDLSELPDPSEDNELNLIASTVKADNEFLKESKTRPPMLKSDSDATVDTGTAMISRATWERILYLEEFTLHQPKISKPKAHGGSLPKDTGPPQFCIHHYPLNPKWCWNSSTSDFHGSCVSLALDIELEATSEVTQLPLALTLVLEDAVSNSIA